MKVFVMRDLIRPVLLGLVIFALFIAKNNSTILGDATFSAVFYSTSIVIILAIISHVTRRILFPRVDLQDLVEKAKEHPVGAGICFGSVLFLLSTLINAGVAMLR